VRAREMLYTWPALNVLLADVSVNVSVDVSVCVYVCVCVCVCHAGVEKGRSE